MNDLVVKQVDVFGDTIVAAQDAEGNVWAGVKWFCEGLGLSEGQTKSERKKIQEDVVLSKGGRNLNLPTNGGVQEVLCLELDFVPLWLAKISITPNMRENNPELVEKLVKYQLKAKDVLAEAFLGKKQVPQTYLEALKELVAVEEEKERLQLELDRSKDWYSIKRVAALNGVSWKTFDWRRLKRIGKQMGYEVRKIFDANYGEVNVYHKDVWEAAYPRYEIWRAEMPSIF